MSGDCIGLGDLVAYYVDLLDIRPGYAAVGKNVMVLKENQEVKKQGVRRRQSTERSEGAKYGNDTTGDEKEPRRRVADSDSDSGSEGGVSDGELEWLEKDIGTIIAKEDPQAKTLKLLSDVQSQLRGVRGKKGGPKKKGVVKSFRGGYTPMSSTEGSFWRMRKLLASVDAEYNSEDDPDYEPGDEVEQVKKPRDLSDTGVDSSFTSGVASSEKGKKMVNKRERLDTVGSSVSVGKRSDRVRAESGGKKLPYWVRALSLPEKFDPEMGKYVAVDQGYSEDKDPDYELPATDEEIDVSEGEDEELEKLVKEALEELPEDLKEGKHKTSKVVSPIKVSVTPCKDGDEQQVDDEILTLDSDEEEISQEKPPGMWVKEIFMKEQPEEYDSLEDPEYVPPSIIYETDKEYDEYSDGGDVIPKEEVAVLLDEQKKHLVPPSTYIPIWVPVPSAAEKIARAKEQVVIKKDESKSETSGKDTDSNGKKVSEFPSVEDIGKEVETPAPKVAELQAVETGLTPIMKKLAVDGKDQGDEGTEKLTKNSESSDVPKPKRERKKSKSKGGDGGDAAAIGAVSPIEKPVNEKVFENGDAARSSVSPVAGEGVVPDSAEKVSDKSKTEKGKKSPAKKSLVKGGNEKSEK